MNEAATTTEIIRRPPKGELLNVPAIIADGGDNAARLEQGPDDEPLGGRPTRGGTLR
jgi:hypothetical protein